MTRQATEGMPPFLASLSRARASDDYNGKPARYSVSPLAGMAAHRRYIRAATGLCAIIEAWPG
jgi:hypothetical protein